MDDEKSNSSSDYSEPETEFPDFSILKPFNKEPRNKVNHKNYTHY